MEFYFVRLLNPHRKVYAFLRGQDDSRVVVMLNLSGGAQTIRVNSDEIEGDFADLLTEKKRTLTGRDQLELGAWECRVYVNERTFVKIRHAMRVE